MKEQFKDINFQAKILHQIKQANEILEDLASQGVHRVTLRQLYYQFVSRDWIKNTVANYKQLGTVISNGRLAGLIDWESIEDRGRMPTSWRYYSGAKDAVESLADGFALNRWASQNEYVELWVEKDALAGVLRPIAAKYFVTLSVNKGYSSSSAMKAAADRFISRGDKDARHILYLGDHDPSGEDMVRDIKDRLTMFGADIEIEKIGLTTAQVRQFKPPPNAVKLSDSRATAYIADHGHNCWEVDAINPTQLNRIVSKAIEAHMDLDAYNKVIEREEVITEKLKEMAADLDEELSDE